MNILIIDKQILYRQSLVDLFLHQADMTVVGEGISAYEAIEMARRLHPDLILMEFNLSDGSSLDAARQILNEQPAARIIFMTEHDNDERLFSAVRLGVRGYLMKNIPTAQLLSAIRGVARGEAALSREMTARLMGEFARSQPVPLSQDAPFAGLTTREMQVLRELTSEATNREIADRLFISENTVRNHMHNILEKLGVSSRRDAIISARRHGIGSSPLPKVGRE
jgi:DNA-binding NarL/FixJ family response regulator